MEVADFFRLAFASGAEHDPETNTFHFSLANVAAFQAQQQREHEFQEFSRMRHGDLSVAFDQTFNQWGRDD